MADDLEGEAMIQTNPQTRSARVTQGRLTRRWLVALLLIGATPCMSLAQADAPPMTDAPSTQSADPARFEVNPPPGGPRERVGPGDRGGPGERVGPGDRLRDRMFRGERGGPGMDRPFLQERMRARAMGEEQLVFSEADWTEAREFMRAHSPKRFEVFEMLPDDVPQKRAARQFILMRHTNIKEIEQTDPPAYQARVRRMELEDEIFGLSVDLRRVNESEQADLRTRLRTRVGEMVDLLIKDRESRITRLEAMVKEERERLASFREGREELIDRKFEQELNAPDGRDPRNTSPRPRHPDDPARGEP